MLLRIAAAALLLAGCASVRGGGSDRPEADGYLAVKELVATYERPASESFFDHIDDSRFPGFESFREKTRQFQIENHDILLDIIVDAVDVNGPSVGVRAHWNKTYVDPQGNTKLLSGKCELVFRRRPSGGLLLTSIHGSSPF